MTATVHTPAAAPAATSPMRSRARLAGVLYLLTFVSIPTLGLYNPIRDHADFILGAGSQTGVLWGAFTEVIVGVAGISTALVLFPVLKRQNESAALGLVAARLVETTLIFVSVTSLLTIITLRTDVAGTAGADNASLTTTGHTLLAAYDRTFLLSQSLMPVFCDLLLGYLLFRSRLVPRILPIVAFVGAPLLLASDIAIFFGVYDRVALLAGLAVIPVAVFELSVGIWLLVKGFNPASPVFAQPNTEAAIPAPRAGDPQPVERGSELVR
ncbi:DUF4386 domain-containing protein [Trujillonella humicola]|uniref:DUF4386 domain-containing protein n=1 Tax=Trujillonella humicola TaxID=3383699 RepID=UPI0039059DFE